jgi:hypothetical protein
MDADKAVTATFTLKHYTLTVTQEGEGTLTQTPSGTSFTHGTAVTLTAAPAAGWNFTGWSGACSGSDACHITMDADKTVTATFVQYKVYIPVVVNRYSKLINGDFQTGSLDGWRALRGGFPGYGGSGLPQSIVIENSSYVARLGDPAFQNGQIPVGYGAISQVFTVEERYLKIKYRVISNDIYRDQNQRYYDTFEASIDKSPEDVTNTERNKVCQNLNPSGQITPPSTGGLILCGGRPNSGAPEDTGWKTVYLDLNNYRGQTITLYLHVWSREYIAPSYLDKGWLNTWVFIDDIVAMQTLQN